MIGLIQEMVDLGPMSVGVLEVLECWSGAVKWGEILDGDYYGV